MEKKMQKEEAMIHRKKGRGRQRRHSAREEKGAKARLNPTEKVEAEGG